LIALLFFIASFCILIRIYSFISFFFDTVIFGFVSDAVFFFGLLLSGPASEPDAFDDCRDPLLKARSASDNALSSSQSPESSLSDSNEKGGG
jgi:hypothetical protein